MATAHRNYQLAWENGIDGGIVEVCISVIEEFPEGQVEVEHRSKRPAGRKGKQAKRTSDGELEIERARSDQNKQNKQSKRSKQTKQTRQN